MRRRLSVWLCPTDLDRARMLDNSVRIQRARTITSVAIGATLVVYAPTYGFWTVALFGVAALNMQTLDARMARSPYPQLHSAATIVLMQSIVAVAVAFSGGPDSLITAWLVLPTAFTAARFRGQVVIAGVVLGLLLLLAATLAVDPRGFLDHPGQALSAAVLLVSVTSAVYALGAAEVQQRSEAVLDHLTGLLNRTSLERRFDELAQQAELTGEPISLVALDIDHFKVVNDEHGHARGDSVLRDLAYALRKQLRSFELIYRLGGEEFLIVLPGSTITLGAALAERVRAMIEQIQPGGLPVTASFGVAGAVGGDTGFQDLFAAADTELYRAKAAGRNCVCVAERHEMHALTA